MNKIEVWVTRATAQYGWSSDFAREITLFLCNCARIFAHELARNMARNIIESECTFHGARAHIDTLISTIYAMNDAELARICMQIRIPAKLRRIILNVIERVSPLTVSSRKNTIIEYTNNTSYIIDNATVTLHHSITIRDVMNADIIVYNAIGMRSLVTLLVREVFARNVTSIIVILHDEDIAIDDAYWVSRAYSGKKISIWCKSERKICAILDITQ